GQQYSFPPNNTPVTKVYVFGRPIYVRQPFVLPLRDDPYNPSVESPPLRDQGSFPVVPAVPVVGNLEQAILKEELMKPEYRQRTAEIGVPLKIIATHFPTSGSFFTRSMRIRTYQSDRFERAVATALVYVNQSGFMCCNRELERVMRDVLEELTADKGWQTCNVQKIANTLQ
ncbi:hypothetical protein OSTOST_17633, partial [Ostertagia ostertagi]